MTYPIHDHIGDTTNLHGVLYDTSARHHHHHPDGHVWFCDDWCYVTENRADNHRVEGAYRRFESACYCTQPHRG